MYMCICVSMYLYINMYDCYRFGCSSQAKARSFLGCLAQQERRKSIIVMQGFSCGSLLWASLTLMGSVLWAPICFAHDIYLGFCESFQKSGSPMKTPTSQVLFTRTTTKGTPNFWKQSYSHRRYTAK